MCGTKFYAAKRNRVDRFCSNECADKYGTIKKIAGRLKQPEQEILNAWKAGLLWCGGLGNGGHWAHESRFWNDRTHKYIANKSKYCKDCYSKKRSRPKARWNVTVSNSWMPALIKKVEEIGSLNRSLKFVNVSWPTYTRRRKQDVNFEKQIHDAKRKFYLREYGGDIKDFKGYHKPSYLVRGVNKQMQSFVETNKDIFSAWVKSSAFKWGGNNSKPFISEIISLATLMFIYSRFANVQSFERLAKFYGRCATFQTLKKRKA